jgi:MoaA/NifB/PqqE/SkfB family radical SAM enzyme
MEKIVELLTGENVRVMALMATIICSYVLLRSQTKGLEYSLGKRIDALDKKVDGVESSLNKRIDGVESSLGKQIDALEKAIDEKIDLKLAAFHAQLKANDFAHLNATIEALTFTLEKNKFLEKEDKEYIDSRLDR